MRWAITLPGILFCWLRAFAWQAAIPPLPPTPKHPVVNEYHGVQVTDNYRWLEDGGNPAVIAWSKAEDQHSRAILDALPMRAEIQQFLKQLDAASSPSFFELQLWNGILFAMYWEPGQQQPMVVTLRSPDDLGSKHVVVDPTKIDATNSTAIQFYVPSCDGSKVAVSSQVLAHVRALRALANTFRAGSVDELLAAAAVSLAYTEPLHVDAAPTTP